MTTVAEQLRLFNEHRFRQFGRAPLPDDPLPMAPTGVGGDVDKPVNFEDNRDAP